MRRVLVIGGLAVLIAALAAGVAVADRSKGNDNEFRYAIGVWGDMPYSDAQALTGVPNVIADMNNADIEFSVQDGDLKAGTPSATVTTVGTCADGLYAQALGYFNALEQPAFFTPGDNDWTDCDRTVNGPFNAVERLQHERDLFFKSDRSLGKRTMRAQVQDAACVGWDYTTGKAKADGACSENRLWTFRDVTYATLNVQGTCNNLCSSGSGDPKAGDLPDGPGAQQARQDEYTAREKANEAWLDTTFAEATAKGSAGVLIVWQADPGFDKSGFQGGPKRDPKTLVAAAADNGGGDFVDGWHDLVAKLRAKVIAYGKPVVLVHGDSHYFMVDKPLVDATGLRVENFTRVETFGDNAPTTNENHWVKVLVDPKSKDVFAFQPQIVTANVVPR